MNNTRCNPGSAGILPAQCDSHDETRRQDAGAPGCCVFTPRRMETLATPLLVTSWVLRIVAAVILLQTLYFKFTGAPESVYIFTKVGLEPWGRYASGVAELFAAILLLVPRTTGIGALLAAGVMVGAIGSHLTRLGIVVQDDGGLLFALAVTVLVCAIVTAILHRRQMPLIGFLFQRPQL